MFDKDKWNAEDEYYEMCPEDMNADGYVDRIEFHMFDDAPSYDSSDNYKWVSRRGWYVPNYDKTSTATAAVPDVGIHDTTASATDSDKVRGGIRAASMLKDSSYNMTVSAFSIGKSSARVP